MKLARPLLALAAVALAAGATAGFAMAGSAANKPIAPPVVTIKTSNLGTVVATKKKLGLYTWDQEKDFKVHCTGACAKQWPPVLLMKGDTVAAMKAGIKGEFGTITRPDGTTQLTFNKQPAYTFVGDTANVVKCDNVDGWHAVRTTAVMAKDAMAKDAMAKDAMKPVAPPVVTIKTSNLGTVVATKKKLGLYTWDQEKDFKVHCTGACAKQWPPVLLMKGDTVAAMKAGIKGEFGTITRPDGTTQLTFNKQPAYTYVGDTANVVKCDNVDGWHAVRAG